MLGTNHFFPSFSTYSWAGRPRTSRGIRASLRSTTYPHTEKKLRTPSRLIATPAAMHATKGPMDHFADSSSMPAQRINNGSIGKSRRGPHDAPPSHDHHF